MAAPKVEQSNRATGEPFIEKYLPEIVLTVSSVALLFFSPLALTFGGAATFAAHYYMRPEMKMEAKDKVVTIPNTIFAIVGAVAALVSLTPAGRAGGIIFKASVLFGPYAIGTTAYRYYKSV